MTDSPLLRRRLSLHLVLMAVLASSYCATSSPMVEDLEPLTSWQFRSAEHVALWYHGLAYVFGSGPGVDTTVLPHFEPSYLREIEGAKRSAGVYPTPLDERAPEFRRIFQGSDTYRALQFLPLYFRGRDALFSGIDAWNRAGGNPYAAGSAEAAQLIAFLSQLFPRAEERQAVVEWTRLIREESRIFHSSYWAGRSALRDSIAAELQHAWDGLAPALGTYLEYIRARGGELFLAPALGAEGRSAWSGVAVPRVAIREPPGQRPEEALWGFTLELLYPIVGDVIREHVAPARLRELGEDRVGTLAALHGGAILLERTTPDRIDEYRRYFLEAAGKPAGAERPLDVAFDEAFPIPRELRRGLENAITAALAGI